MNANRQKFFLVMALVALTWIVFGQTRRHGFVNFDDDLYIYENPTVTRGLTPEGIRWAFAGPHASNWHPLTWMSHMLDCELYGLNPGGHHVTSVLLHAATAVALFLVLHTMTGASWRSGFVAAVFAIHPLRVESVAWIAERKDVLSGFFFVLTLGAYVRYVRQPSLARYLVVALAFALGIMAKPMVVTLPFVLLLLDHWPLQRLTPATRGRLVREKLPLFALSSAACLVTLFAQQEAMTPTPLLLRVGNALVACVVYLGQMIFPSGLAVYYPHPGNSLPLWQPIAALVFLLAVSAVAIVTRARRPWILFGWLWYLGMLVPVIGVLQVGSQAHADRYTYLPQIGVYVMLTWTVAELCAGWRPSRALLGGVSAAIVATLAFCARAQATWWRNSEMLWTRALACTSRNVVAHDNLGHVLLEQGRADEAIVHFQRALEISPDHASAHNNLANALLGKGRIDDALAHYQSAVQLKPGYAEAHNNFGVALFRRGRPDEAVVHFRAALQIDPQYAFAHNSLGQAMLEQGRLDEAIAGFKQALALKPDYAEAHYNFGNALLRQGKLEDATARYRDALRFTPDYPDAANDLAYVLLQQHRSDDAIALFQKTLAAHPENLNAHYNLGTALLGQDRLDEAAAQFQEVLRIQSSAAPARNNLAFISFRKGDLREATAQYAAALELQPENVSTLSNLAWVLATCPDAALRNGPKAIELSRLANRLSGGQNPLILRTLAAALAEGGQFGEAAKIARDALPLARANADTGLAEMLSAQIRLYQTGAPFRDSTLTAATHPARP